MAKLDAVDGVGVHVRDQKQAKQFYTRKVGLVVRAQTPKIGYLALGATKGGPDADLTLWQPDPKWGAEMYEAGVKSIGGVTGIGFRTSNLPKTIEALKRRGVNAEVDAESEERFGRFTDPDGNVVFIIEPPKSKPRRAGLAALSFITVASRDEKNAGTFFTKALGMKGVRIPGERGSEGFVTYQFSPKGTGIMPFTPKREMYKNPADYDTDMAHIGENTYIGFSTKDIYGVQENLLSKGVRFKDKAEKQDWGGIRARILDPDDNVYGIFQME